MQEAFYDPQSQLCCDCTFRAAGQAWVRKRQGQWQPHLSPSLAKIGFDCGSGAEVRGGQGPATLPPSQVEVHPTVGQGMLIINIILAHQ